jgi:small subunit ribosomal protein S20
MVSVVDTAKEKHVLFLVKLISCLLFHQVLRALEKLRKKPDAQPEEIIEIEKLIAEAYKAIDKTVKVGAMHRNTGNHRKSRLARRKKAIEILRGWYVPNAEPTAATT